MASDSHSSLETVSDNCQQLYLVFQLSVPVYWYVTDDLCSLVVSSVVDARLKQLASVGGIPLGLQHSLG